MSGPIGSPPDRPSRRRPARVRDDGEGVDTKKVQRRTLNLRGYQIFDAVARHRSLTRAAEELSITQSAVSHALRALAQRLGEPLIERSGRSIALTETGLLLAASLGTAFDIIEERVHTIEEGRAVVRLGLYSSFAGPWFIGLLDEFHRAHPDVDLRLVMLYDPHEISTRIADVFITSEDPGPDFIRRDLFAERLVPVAHPSVSAGFPDTLPLISAEVEPRVSQRAWLAFAALNAVEAPADARRWRYCSHYIFAFEMALKGYGAALLPDFMVADAIARGTLARLPGQPLPTGQSYALQLPRNRRQEDPIRTLSGWIQRATSRLGDV